ncbi:MAG: nucleotidyltransferase family protein [Eubacteriales bacterium]|jgi:hypothetical protein
MNIFDASKDEFFGYYLALLKSALNGSHPPEPPCGFSFARLYSFSSQNHTAHMLCGPIARMKTKPDMEIDRLFLQQYALALSRDAEQRRAFEEIAGLQTQNGVDLLPVKGIELKALYPSPEMRRMADIDIIYNSHGNDEKVKRLMESLGYACKSWGGGHHDIFCRLPSLNIELHRRADYPEYFDRRLLPDSRIPGLYHLAPADFYVLLLAHNAKHLRSGGLGVRAVCDIYVLRKHFGEELRSSYTAGLLEKNGLSAFAGVLGCTCKNWFEYDTPVIDETGRFLLAGLTYGSSADCEAAILTARHGGSKSKYLLSRLFPGADRMKARYRTLERHPYLLPVFWGIRGGSVLLSKTGRRKAAAARKVLAYSDEAQRQRKYIMRAFGLEGYTGDK